MFKKTSNYLSTCNTALKLESDNDSSNSDLKPVEKENRTYTVSSYIAYWTVGSSCVTTWTIGSSLLDLGLSARYAMACIVGGAVCIGILCVLCGWPGRKHHIGFSVITKAQYGLRGAYLIVVLRFFTLVMWFAIQSYWGAQSFRILIGAVIPGFVNGALSELLTTNLQKNDLICMFIWLIVYMVLVFYVPPNKMQHFFFASFFAFAATAIGLLAWSVSTNHGKVGELFTTPKLPQYCSSTMDADSCTPNKAWLIFQGMASVLGTWGGGALSQSDWTRFARSRHSPLFAQLLTPPILISITALIGIIVTSASGSVLGIGIDQSYPWSPMDLLSRIQKHYNNSSSARAAVFFGSLGTTLSQLAISISFNSVSAAMDLSALFPSYINIRRGCLLFGPLFLVIQPWQLTSQTSIFLQVLSGFGLFLVSQIGVFIASYFFVFRGQISLSDLYGDSIARHASKYWYFHGFSWVSLLSFAMGVAFVIPGWGMVVHDPNNVDLQLHNNWVKLYNLSAFLGIAIAAVSVVVFHYIQQSIKSRSREPVKFV